ncbi:hypothetical protein APHAL10511_001928 [Amanita phalloides]|nr:hypothetical protein APHAL10511_001928 [Amanita phalloides]
MFMRALRLVLTLLLGSVSGSVTWTVLAWILRLAVFSLLLRTYIIPWLLASTSKHIRVKSISLRSIRGLYIRTGVHVCYIERITYAWAHISGARRINIIIDGLNLQLSNKGTRKPTRHKRNLTLADLSPSPLARLVLELLGDLYAYFDPYIRPRLRTWVVNRIRFLLRWLPRISQAVSFDLHAAVITLPDMQKMEINAESINLHTTLSLIPSNRSEENGNVDRGSSARVARSRPSYSSRAWGKRFKAGFQRSLDRALGDSRAAARISLHLQGLHVLTLSNVSECKPLVQLPGQLDLDASVSFNPRAGTLDEQSLETTVRIGDCIVHADSVISFLNEFKEASQTLSRSATVVNSEDAKEFQEMAITPLSSNPFRFSLPSMPPLESPFFSPALSSRVPSISSMSSPASPFLGAISASLRSRLRHIVPCHKLKEHKCNSTFSFLRNFLVILSRVNVVYIGASAKSEHSYQAAMQNISFRAFRSSPLENALHVDVLGKRQASEKYDPEVYGLQISIGGAGLQRHTITDVWDLLSLGRLDLQVLVSQWPFPWLSVSPFMSSDPNAAVLAVRGHADGATVMERLEDLHPMLELLASASKSEDQPRAPSVVKSFPRVFLQLSCGPLIGSIVCKAPDGYKPLVVELKTKGVNLHASSHFQSDKTTYPITIPEHEVRMQCDTSLVVEPIFAIVHPGTTLPNANDQFSEMDLVYHPTALSMETIDLRSRIFAIAKIDDRIGAIACVDTSTLTIDTHMSGDALCVELWHPDVVAAILQILTALPAGKVSRPRPDAPKPTSTSLGFSTSVGVARLVVFVTSPDVSPHDDLSLSRGIALRSTIAIHSCSLATRHLRLLGDIHDHSVMRQELDLAQEICMEASAAAQHLHDDLTPSQFLKFSASDLLVRGAVATPFEKDDPLIIEHDGNGFASQEFLCVEYMEIKMLRHARSPENRNISIDIPSVKLSFLLSHVYELMLALQTFQSIQQVRSATPAEPSGLPPTFLVIESNVSNVQIVWNLPKQTLLTQIHGLKAEHLSDTVVSVGFDQVQLSSLASSKFGIDQDIDVEREELLNFQSWQFQIPQKMVALEIVADGESALFRIPFGYVFADLMIDALVVFKAARHIVHMAKAGHYEEFPVPEPEGPKSVPHFRISLRHLVFEASDDPFESQLGLIWRAGREAVKTRLDREKAFEAKVAIIHAAETGSAKASIAGSTEYRFDASHTISVSEARQRLDEVHTLDWVFKLEQERRRIAQTERTFIQCLRSTIAPVVSGITVPDSQAANDISERQTPPLFRVALFDVDLRLYPPSFVFDHLSRFLSQQGNLPSETLYTLLMPMHIHLTLSALHATLRDYSLPLVSIPAPSNGSKVAFEFDTDLVIAEEMGTGQSIDWVDCPLILPNQGVQGVLPFSIAVPRTMMPVKTYANPLIEVTTDRATTFTWGISYGPAIQDLMRIVDTLSSGSRDESPPIGFWDKLKLVFHWTFRVMFASEVLLHLKGSRDPHDVNDAGAGFVFCWQGNTKLLINRENSDEELVQVTSDSLIFAIPNLQEVSYNQSHHMNPRYNPSAFRKICAKFQSGVRFGVGVVLERSCGTTCPHCSGPSFERKCRLFNFVPHHWIKLEKKKVVPYVNSPGDSYDGFRSDFVHLSVSLASSLSSTLHDPSSFHLTSKSFAHFWSWWALFDGTPSLPVRQGTYYPRRMVTPKLGRHLATIKYRLLVPHLFLMHGYLDDTEETWVDGVSPWIGLKGMIDHFQADFHQRDEEAAITSTDTQTPKSLRRRAFYAAEVVLKGVDLRTLVATFPEPGKRNVTMSGTTQRSNYRTRKDLPPADLTYPWYDPTDFIETDWASSETPELHILPIATCPYFAYFKRNTAFAAKEKHLSKFGIEKSHTCLLGTEPSLYHVQINLAQMRITQLEKQVHIYNDHNHPEASRLRRMIALLREYISLIDASCVTLDNHQNYLLPSESVSPNEWAEFDNVYQVHSPTLYLDAPIRDILMRYYYCSRDRRGFEYHLAARAVKFIRDQANAAIATVDDENVGRSLSPTQAAASALRKIWRNDFAKSSEELFTELNLDSFDTGNPLDGWSDGVSLHRNHYCLLLKPQVVLRGELNSGPCVVAAIQTKLQSFAIMDDLNADDPVSGKVMSRNYTALLGLQAFSPSRSVTCKGPVPLEVLVDLKCENDEFDRLVPQTDAMFHYDKFNRLRLSNTVNSAVTRMSQDKAHLNLPNTSHLRDQTDLLRIHIPRFTVLASDKHFQCIAHMVTELLLYTDAAHKTRMERLEDLLIKYDFTDFCSAAGVVENLQHRLRNALENERQTRLHASQSIDGSSDTDLLNIRAHIFILAQELHLLFDAIRLAQDKSDGKNDHKSALLLHASSSVLSWNMLANGQELISKLEIQDTIFSWLSRQDGSTVSNLKIGNLEAFDGSQHAQWTEILSKHDEPSNHPLLKKGLFLIADWIILPPVGGISIYETFELSFHPIRLQMDAKVGKRIMEYLWPARKERNDVEDDASETASPEESEFSIQVMSPTRTSLDSPRALYTVERQAHTTLTPPMRKLASSRSFTDLRSPKQSVNGQTLYSNRSTESLSSPQSVGRVLKSTPTDEKTDATDEMKARSNQKTFILVRVSSLDILLSALKEGSFECHDARIKTRQLEYHDKTWSFEELVDQFIPSNLTWRGWLKMALQQPLVPVFPAARELFLKTKFSRTGPHPVKDSEDRPGEAGIKLQPDGQKHSTLRKIRRKQTEARPTSIAESEQSAPSLEPEESGTARRRVFSIFGRSNSRKDHGT